MSYIKCGVKLLLLLSLIFVSQNDCFGEKYAIPRDELSRIIACGELAGKAKAVGLNWKPYFHKFMEIEGKKHWTDYQLAFIGAYFGSAMGNAGKKCKSTSYLEREKIKSEFTDSFEKLYSVTFSATPTAQTKLLWYDLGPNNNTKSLIIYPVGRSNHGLLFVRFNNNHVQNIEARRVPSVEEYKDFNPDVWKKSGASQRLLMTRDLAIKKLLIGKTEKEVIALLGKPDGEYLRNYGYSETVNSP